MEDGKLNDLSEELLSMSNEDQTMRKSGVWDAEVDRKNTLRVKEIIAAIGWPTISKVGEQAAGAAWLLVQHADKRSKIPGRLPQVDEKSSRRRGI